MPGTFSDEQGNVVGMNIALAGLISAISTTGAADLRLAEVSEMEPDEEE